MAIAGAAFGASKALEDIVAQRLLEQKLEAEIADRNARMEMDRQRFDEGSAQNKFERERALKRDADESADRTRAADLEAGERRGRSNMAGVLSMGLDPATAKREIAYSSLQSGANVPNGVIQALTPPEPERDPIADYEAKKKIDRKYETPGQPSRPQVFQVNGKLVDANGRLVYDGGGNAGGVDPAKAKEKGTSMLNAAKSLRNHPGLASLTGARIGNPDYGLGVSDEPIAGSKAADAQPFFNQFKSLATLDNIGLLKGVLSDSDMKLLAAAGTSLDTKMQDPTFVDELDKVIQKLEGAFGDKPAMTPMNPVSSHGTGAPAPTGKRFTITKIGG